jgi:hypothetical protein
LHFDKAGGSEIPVPQDEGTETSTAAASLPPLLTVWDCDYVVRQCQGKGWLCKHCNLVFPNLHATRALAHCAKIPGNSIRICQALQPAAYLQRYKDLWNLTNAKISARKRAQIAVDEHTAARQEGAASSLASKKMKNSGDNSAMYPMDSFVSKTPRDHSVLVLRPSQTSIDSGIEKLGQGNITTSIHARLEVAIADMLHCHNIADRVADSSCLKLVIDLARMSTKDFKIPNRKKVGGPLLDLNYDNCKRLVKEELLKSASTFSLCWLSDGATIVKTPYINILGFHGAVGPSPVAIEDCHDHMFKGGKKDASYIATLMDAVIAEYDPNKFLTDIFWFDGAGNVQKGGRILEAIYPRSYCFHGGEHVVALFFDDLGRLKSIRVRISFIAFLHIVNDTLMLLNNSLLVSLQRI